MLTAVIIGLILLGLLGLVVLGLNRQRQFFTKRAAEATRAGLHPAPLDPVLEGIAKRVFSPEGSAGQGVAGPVGQYWVRAMDFSYPVSRSSTAAKTCVIAVNLPVALPPLEVRKGNPMIGGVELESAAFNEQFWVDSPDARYATAFLHPRMMELLLANQPMEWRVEGDLLVAWYPAYWTVPLVRTAADTLIAIAELIPPFVIADYGLS